MLKAIQFLQRPFHGKKQKGVTFLEILAVLVILVLIYLAYARSFGQGTDKAKLSDVQNTFKQFQLSFESTMNENSGLPIVSTSLNGKNADYSAINNYLQKEYKITTPTVGDTTATPTNPVNPIQTDAYLDPWKTAFSVQAKYISASDMLLGVRTSGKDKLDSSTTDIFTTGGTNDADDVIMVTEYSNGVTRTCTKGLSKDLGSMNIQTSTTILGCN